MQSSASLNHPTFYYADGSIVFGCKNLSGGTTYFRIHQSYLANQSTVVSDMLTLPNTDNGTHEMHDGVPLVNFPDTVTAEAMEMFLTFFYEPTNNLLSKDDIDIAYNLFDVLVLADMFLVDKLKTSIIDRLMADWTFSSPEEYKVRVKALNPDPEERRHNFHEPAAVIRVAQRFDTSLIHPLQFFELSFRDSLLPYQPFSASGDNPINPGARWEFLSLDVKKKAQRGRAWFLEKFISRLESVMYVNRDTIDFNDLKDTPCLNPEDDDGGLYCETALRNQISLITANVLRGYHPLREILEAKLGGELGYYFYWEFEEEAIHAKCAARFDSRLDILFEELFNVIPNCYTNLT